ncbi:MAG: SRPBCC domain-containing protein [Flavobacteriales bacterium]|nr:SRPBCC domain-containing protein [Flavobacteriales bacterium]MDG1767758.1 SRPBCC domain-containing protein [Flavobacteriales bacterium]
MISNVTVSSSISASISHVWESWTNPKHIVKWNFAHESWKCPAATNNLFPGGDFSWRMEAVDGSMGFDYAGKYIEIEDHAFILKQLNDGREVSITFEVMGDEVLLSEIFEIEHENSAEQQRMGWQAILDNFKRYTEQWYSSNN